jgi:DNA uptake protein ComE-like DNA-binding protein
VIRRGREDEGGGIIFGVSDEESRLNLNTATADELAKLQNMMPDVATAIVNWRGGDSTTGAAEAQYYAGLQPPYQPRNGPFQTVREMLMIRGVTPELFLGKDVHQNGMLASSGENDLAGSVDSSDLGWAGILTVDSTVQNLNAAGEDRVNIQSADENSLTAVKGITPQIARAIVSYRTPARAWLVQSM